MITANTTSEKELNRSVLALRGTTNPPTPLAAFLLKEPTNRENVRQAHSDSLQASGASPSRDGRHQKLLFFSTLWDGRFTLRGTV